MFISLLINTAEVSIFLIKTVDDQHFNCKNIALICWKYQAYFYQKSNTNFVFNILLFPDTGSDFFFTVIRKFHITLYWWFDGFFV